MRSIFDNASTCRKRFIAEQHFFLLWPYIGLDLFFQQGESPVQIFVFLPVSAELVEIKLLHFFMSIDKVQKQFVV